MVTPNVAHALFGEPLATGTFTEQTSVQKTSVQETPVQTTPVQKTSVPKTSVPKPKHTELKHSINRADRQRAWHVHDSPDIRA